MEEKPSGIVYSDVEKPCAVCGRLTARIDITHEVRLCSKFCADKFTEQCFPNGNA